MKYIVLGVTLALFAVSNGYLLWRVSHMNHAMSQWQEAVSAEITELKEHSATANSASSRRLEALQEELALARQQATSAAGQARVAAQKHAEKLAQQIAQEIAEEQAKQQEAVATEISELKENAGSAHSRIEGVSGEVAQAKSDIDKTIADLRRVNGDMGVMSGLIATNAQELAALKALGERNYFEFELKKNNRPQRVGNILLKLKKADAKRNKYTIDVVADDKTFEKKDKNTNEPVQFYVAKLRQPYELVVNEVRKDAVVGYLATPKVQEVASR